MSSPRLFFHHRISIVRRQVPRKRPLIRATTTVTLLLILIPFANFAGHAQYPSRNGATMPHTTLKPHHNPRTTVLLLKEEGGRQSKSATSDPYSLLPPLNVSAEERISWFRNNLRRFKIIHQSRSSRRFAMTAGEFFSSGCEIRFFMTWISSAESFGQREFLSLESLFKQHPMACVLMLSKSMDSLRGRRILQPLSANGYRVLALAPDLPFLFNSTPASIWFKELKKGNVDPGEIPLAQNLSNLLRLAILYKFGGVYIDADVIILRKLSTLRNSIGAQAMKVGTGQWSRLNNAVLVFDENHPLLLRFIKEFALTFDGSKWGHNGPYLVSRVVARVAKKPGFNNFSVLPPAAFYPADWSRIGGYFQSPTNPAMSRWVEAKLVQLQGQTYAIHLWNKVSNKMRTENGSIIQRLTSQNCIICNY